MLVGMRSGLVLVWEKRDNEEDDVGSDGKDDEEGIVVTALRRI